ncbi:MAG: DeoR/GlpR family DNA-binding transcription regulator [Turicibacter sp.]
MLAETRHKLILSQLNKAGQVSVQALSKDLSVSTETIRRDITTLSDMNLLTKVHGGAISIKKNRHEGNYLERREESKKEKELIGKYAASLIADHDVIAIDTGATMDWLCEAIPNLHNLTIIISSISALNILCNRIENGEISARIIFLGGQVDVLNRYTQGTIPLNLLDQFSVDKAFITATSVAEDGLKMYDIYDGEFTKKLISRSKFVYYLGSSKKLGHDAFYKICDLSELDMIVCDDVYPFPHSLKQKLDESQVKIEIINTGEPHA